VLAHEELLFVRPLVLEGVKSMVLPWECLVSHDCDPRRSYVSKKPKKPSKQGSTITLEIIWTLQKAAKV